MAKFEHLTEDEFVGKVALVTGASGGIGEATVLELASRKAKVIMLVRSMEKGEAACHRIREAYPAADLQLYQVDLSLVNSVADFCRKFRDKVDILVNNCGVFGCPYNRTTEGVEIVLASNHLGHFLLTCLLLADGLLGSSARIILVTGAMYKRGDRQVSSWDAWTPENYNKTQAYRNSKLAVCLFALWLRSGLRRVHGSSSAKVFAVHPGVVNTNIARHLLQGCLPPCAACLRCCMRAFLHSPSNGCRGIVMCATDRDDANRVSGAYFNGCREESWHRDILDDELVVGAWDFSYELVERCIRDADEVLAKLKSLRQLPRDSLVQFLH